MSLESLTQQMVSLPALLKMEIVGHMFPIASSMPLPDLTNTRVLFVW